MNPITVKNAQRRGVAGYRMPFDVSPSSAIPGTVDYHTSTTSELTASPAGEFLLKQNAGQPLRFIGVPRAWDGATANYELASGERVMDAVQEMH